MLKIISWLLIILGTAIMVISTSPEIMQVISKHRLEMFGPFGERRSRGGDLMRMSFLENENKFLDNIDPVQKKPEDTGTRKNLDLYVYGDSYLLMVPDSSFFARVNKYQFGRRDYNDLLYRLDRHQKNVLLIEVSERFIRTYLPHSQATYDHVKPATDLVFRPPLQIDKAAFNVNSFFNTSINQNLEYNLFNYNFLNTPRYSKAGMNHRWFNRVSGDVVLSDDGTHLFYRPTVDPQNDNSSFKKVTQNILDRIGNNIDSLHKHYKREGFDEVYFSLIPNPVTILQPEGYNQMIPALQARCAARGIPFIDVYGPYSQHPDPASLFRKGDTHWTAAGCHLWLDIINRELVKLSER